MEEPSGAAPAAVPAEAVTPLIRGVAVLHRLTEAGGALSPSALERATGLARSTIDRITATLARMGYVRLDGRDVVLAPRLMELGNAYLAALRLPALLAGRADALADALDESVSLAVADRDGIRFIHQATRRRAMSLSFRIGDLLPAERTAPGALFATEWTEAEWRRRRERRAADPEDRGFPAVPPRPPLAPDDFEERTARAARENCATDDQLIEPGLIALSVPVRGPGARPAPRAGAGAVRGPEAGREPEAGRKPGAGQEPGARQEPEAGQVPEARQAPGAGRIVCVASVVSHTSRHTAEHLRTTLLPRLRETVAAMERDLAAAPPPAPSEPPAGLATWTAASKQELGREFVESLARGLTVLTAFDADRPALTLAEVAKATGLPRATARRVLITYEHLGLVAAGPDRRFTLTPRVLSLGFPPLSRTSLPRIAQPHLEYLAARVHESASLAVLTPSGDEIQYTARAAAGRIMSVDLTVGTRLPAHATALGRALTGALTEDGYALVDEELEEGLRAVAVPVRDRSGRPVAAANVALHAARRTREECVTELLPALRRTAAAIEADYHVAARFTRVALV
ncbi:helix-turn-helix domain-containing protein [Streptomyces sp. SID89]|nr:helix-turn-helix domain-containing protein [Streptomyces sp. SID89]